MQLGLWFLWVHHINHQTTFSNGCNVFKASLYASGVIYDVNHCNKVIDFGMPL